MHSETGLESDLAYLRNLELQLRAAIIACLSGGRADHAVALDTARDFVEAVLIDREPTSTRVRLARARAEIALESVRDVDDIRH